MTATNFTEAPDRSFAIVTPTYVPDLSRCELLVDSLEQVAPSIPHYLIVDRHDRIAFKHLIRGKRQIVESEALVGKWIRRMPGRKGLWLSMKAPPVRGWIIQQILKIAMMDVIKERTLVFCDSDTAFMRRFNRDDLLVEGKIGLLDVDFANDSTRRWSIVARRLLGLPPGTGELRNYVGNMICWNRETVAAMRGQIERSTGLDWRVALARCSSFSEYMLYGVFVREVLGYAAVNHAPSAVPLVKPSWGVALSTDAAIDAFFADFDPRTVAVMLHSKDEVNLARVRFHLERWWNVAQST